MTSTLTAQAKKLFDTRHVAYYQQDLNIDLDSLKYDTVKNDIWIWQQRECGTNLTLCQGTELSRQHGIYFSNEENSLFYRIDVESSNKGSIEPISAGVAQNLLSDTPYDPGRVSPRRLLGEVLVDLWKSQSVYGGGSQLCDYNQNAYLNHAHAMKKDERLMLLFFINSMGRRDFRFSYLDRQTRGDNLTDYDITQQWLNLSGKTPQKAGIFLIEITSDYSHATVKSLSRSSSRRLLSNQVKLAP